MNPTILLSRTRRQRPLRWLFPLLLTATACFGGGDSGDSGGAIASLELDATYSEPFSALINVRELPDGRLFAADPLSQVLLRVDLDTGKADTLGRVGGGPGEYRQPDQVYPLPGDSTLLVDLGKMQLTVLGPDGALHEGISMALTTENGPPGVILPRAVDAQGGIYYSAMAGLGQGPPDSTTIARYDRATGATETAVVLWRPEPRVERSGNSVRMTATMMEGRDDWAVGPDGRVAVIRANGYSVEWHNPAGRVVSGPENSFETIPIGEADKEVALEERASGGAFGGVAVMVSQSASGGTSMQMMRGGSMGMADEPSVSDFQWAESFAPFRPDRSRVSPENEVWVQRWLPADRPQLMDVFDSTGVRTGTVELPDGLNLIGFGHGPDGGEVAYLTHTDEVGLVWLSRYRVVRSRS